MQAQPSRPPILAAALAALAVGGLAAPSSAAPAEIQVSLDAPPLVLYYDAAPTGQNNIAYVAWPTLPPGTGCTDEYFGLQSQPAGVTLVESQNYEADGERTQVLFTAAAAGTYEIRYGYDGCHLSAWTTVVFKDELNPGTAHFEPAAAKVGETVKYVIDDPGDRWIDPGLVCTQAIHYDSTPAGLKVVSHDYGDALLVTAEKAGTYEFSWGSNGCENTPTATVTFTAAGNPSLLEQLVAFLTKFIQQLLALLRGF
jgi:hypothetical protein